MSTVFTVSSAVRLPVHHENLDVEDCRYPEKNPILPNSASLVGRRVGKELWAPTVPSNRDTRTVAGAALGFGEVFGTGPVIDNCVNEKKTSRVGGWLLAWRGESRKEINGDVSRICAERPALKTRLLCDRV